MPPVYDSLCQGMCCVNRFEAVLDTLRKIDALIWRAPEGDIGYPCVDKVFVQEFDVLFVRESNCPQAFASPSAALV